MIVEFKRIFTEHWSKFVASIPRYNTDYYHAEINKMLTCGTEANGFVTYQCLCCGKGEHKINFSCKGKACPQCGKRYARDSMCKIAAKLFPGVRYRQVVLTIPEQLRIPFYQHPDQGKLYSKFMGISHVCLEELIQGMFKNTDYKIAPIVFIHTHGRNGSYNPHLHVILAEGAFHPQTTEWKSFRSLPLGKLRHLWQKHLLTLVAAEYGELNGLVNQLWEAYPDGFYTNPGNNDHVPTKN